MAQEQNIKAVLKIVLKANDTIIAESVDPILWQYVLGAINTPSDDQSNKSLVSIGQTDKGNISAKVAVQELAKEIGVPVQTLQGACSPSDNAPFIYLDKHHWEAMKKATPARGPKAISPTVLAATLLFLWKEKGKLGDSTVSDSQKVLDTINVNDNHSARALNNCEWLQLRGKNIIINPSPTSKAIAFVKAYCTKQWDKWDE